MSDADTLKLAVDKAVSGGYIDPYRGDKPDIILKQYTNNKYKIIYSHDFAKALWGDAKVETSRLLNLYDEFNTTPKWVLELMDCWKHHLQEMVIADNPIEYLANHLD